MTISSMTGFSRIDGEKNIGNKDFNWYWEIKSVNGKGLDIKAKTPSWLEYIIPTIKNIASKYFVRGNMGVYLNLTSSQSEKEIMINEDALESLIQVSIKYYKKYKDNVKKPSISELISLKSIAEFEEAKLTEEEQKELEDALVADFEKLCKKLKEDRDSEGDKMAKVLLEKIDAIEEYTDNLISLASNAPEKIKERLLENVKIVCENIQISEERLMQEVTFYVVKADIKEETDRLKSHIQTARDLIKTGGAIGRRFDFLCQEFNREANTSCSKSFDIEITNIGMELKTVIDQLREQSLNIE